MKLKAKANRRIYFRLVIMKTVKSLIRLLIRLYRSIKVLFRISIKMSLLKKRVRIGLKANLLIKAKINLLYRNLNNNNFRK
jgi:hypothetical protein